MAGAGADPGQPAALHLTYVIAAGSDLAVIGPGWEHGDTGQALARGLGGVGAGPADVTGVVVTHAHPDHHGLSARLQQAPGAWIAMHPAERDSLPARHWRGAGSRRADLAWLRACGVPGDVAAELAVTDLSPVLRMPEPGVLPEDGDLVKIGGFAGAEALPAHEYRFHGLADRVRLLLAHHDRRCEEVTAILARLGPATMHLRHLAGLGRIRETAGGVLACALPSR